MATNQQYERGEHVTIAGPLADNSGIGPINNEPLLQGKEACVCISAYTLPARTPTGDIGVAKVGQFFLTVVAKSSISPGTGAAIGIGDKIYADGGTLDATNNVTYGFTLDANSSTGVFFGFAEQAISSGQTAIIGVRLKVGG